MRTRAVWADQFVLYGWQESHSAIVPLKVRVSDGDEPEWIEPKRRFHGEPRYWMPSGSVEPRRVHRTVSRRLYGWRFRMESMDTWDMFDRMSRSQHCEWRDGVLGPYLSESDEQWLLSKGDVLLQRWTDGDGRRTVSPWRRERGTRNRGWGPIAFIREVMSSRWWSDRMGVGHLLLVPSEEFLPSRPSVCRSTVSLHGTFKSVLTREWCRDYRWRISLSRKLTSPMGIALELLREGASTEGGVMRRGKFVNRDRLAAFAVRFWGEKLSRELLS